MNKANHSIDSCSNYFLLLIFIFISSNVFPQDQELSWKIMKPPKQETFHTIRMFSVNYGFITGKNSYEFNGLDWVTSKTFGDLTDIDIAVVKSARNIWVTKHTSNYESELFHFNGNSWEKIPTRLANLITALDIDENGYGWFGGFREVAYRDVTGWKFLPYPDNFTSVRSIKGSKNQVWINTLDKKLFFYDGLKWQQFFEDDKIGAINFNKTDEGYALGQKTLYKYEHGVWKIHSSSELLTNILKLAFAEDEIWGVGLSGKIVRWQKGSWTQIKSPTTESFLDIQMLSKTSGYIAGVNGIILVYSEKLSKQENQILSYFDICRILPIEIALSDEYGVGIADFNDDGLNDIYTVCLSKPNRMFINRSVTNSQNKIISFQFEDLADESGVSSTNGLVSKLSANKTQIGVGLADIENDGDHDIYITNLSGKNQLYLNNGNAEFRNVTKQKHRGTELTGRWNAAVFGDVNNDGYLDLFVTNEESSNRLFLNDGNGYFKDITETAGVKTNGSGMGATFGDVNGDGKLDIFVTNWSCPNKFYINISKSKNEVRFKECAKESGVDGEFYSKSNAAVFADYDNDGDLDLFVTNRKASNKLYKNDGFGIFSDVTQPVIGTDSLLSNGANFADFDQDGFMDLFVANAGQNVLYKNIRGEKFVKMKIPQGNSLDAYDTGSAFGDMDNDGDLDIYVSNYVNGESELFLNAINKNNFVKLNLHGSISNRDAIGAKVWLYQSGKAENKNFLLGYREVNGGSGYVSSNSKQVHFGLGDLSRCDIVILFPVSGIKSVYHNVKNGTVLNIYEENGLAGYFTLWKSFCVRFLTNPETNKELLKFGLLVILIAISVIRGNKKFNWDSRWKIVLHGKVILGYITFIYFFIYSEFMLNIILPFTYALVSFVIIHLYYERVVMAKLAKIEKQQTRDRIARDLHDDLAATLSSTVIYTQVLQKEFPDTQDNKTELLGKINKLLNDASNSITDIIWDASPIHDKLDELVFRLNMIVADTCKVNKINYAIEGSDDIPNLEIKEEVRRNTYLIFKEALNNSVKHSNASHITLQCKINHNYFEIELSDDGKGFENNEAKLPDNNHQIVSRHGRGLKNMRHRADEIGAVIKIITLVGEGTTISLRVKIM